MEVECMCSSAHKQRGVLMMTVWRCKKITIILIISFCFSKYHHIGSLLEIFFWQTLNNFHKENSKSSPHHTDIDIEHH